MKLFLKTINIYISAVFDTTMYRHRDLTIRVHRLKCLTPIFTLATTGLPDIKRRNPRIRAIHLSNTQISAKCVTYLCQAGNHVHTHYLH